jgi:Ca-activated chloride channel family protein
MNKLIRFFQQSRDRLESEGATSFLANPAGPPRADYPPGARAVIITIDVSPSMEQDDYHPTRLEGAKRAVQRYLGIMSRQEPETLIGIVDFHGEAELVTHPLPIGNHHRQLLEFLMRLHTGSCTNIGAALQLSGRELARIHSPRNPEVILLTDGDSNQGPDPVTAAEELKARGIQLDIIGIGGSPAEVNERDLKRMASVRNGQLRYWFIESADALIKQFEALALREID